jgi:hypothetical protein
MTNSFLTELEKIPTSNTENGALAHNTTGSSLLNYFSNCNNFKRSYSEVELDLNKCWYENKHLTIKLIGYIRAISRTSKDFKLSVKGLGLKHEGRLCLRWLYINHPNIFYKNLPIFIDAGSFADLWHRDLMIWMSNSDSKIAQFIVDSLLKEENNLCLKYLPRHKSISNIKKRKPGADTIQFHLLRNKSLRLVCDLLEIETGVLFTVRDLMKWKAEGKAHNWQQLISTKNSSLINFEKLPGKVLQWITKEKEGESFISRHNLEDRYITWLNSKSNINNTSYIYELIKPAIEKYSEYKPKELSKIQKYTIEKQINNILSNATKSKLNIMPVLDTSGSMGSEVVGNVTALDICLSLGIYFSMLQSGSFKDSVIAFDTKSEFIKLSGSYLDRLKDILAKQDFMGSTNFQSVVDLIIKTRIKNPNIAAKDYPDVYLVISDLQFNDISNNYSYYEDYYTSNITNHKEAIKKFDEVGLPQPLFIWYNVSCYGNNNFQNHKDDNGVINMSGFDPGAINRLMSEDFQLQFEKEHNKSIKDITPYEAMVETLNQEYLSLLTV